MEEEPTKKEVGSGGGETEEMEEHVGVEVKTGGGNGNEEVERR